jgi:hypothetical protein
MNWWEWVFSGIGVLGLGLLIEWLRRRSRSSGLEATITAQGAKVSDSPVASGTGITQNVNSPTFNVSLPAAAPGSPGNDRYNEWRELTNEIHESLKIMASAFLRSYPGIIDVDAPADYHDGIRKGDRAFRNRILIADVLKNAGMLEKFKSIVEYAVSADTPRDPTQQGCPTAVGFDMRASEFEEELMELARNDSGLASIQVQPPSNLHRAASATNDQVFEVELLGASRSIYTFERGDSPYVDIGATVRIHNRNDSPTTVFVRSIAVKVAIGVERGLERAVMIRPGPISSIEDVAGFNSYEVPGCSSVELTLSTRKYNPSDLGEYLEGSSPEIVIDLGETFGNSRKLMGPMKFGGAYKQ